MKTAIDFAPLRYAQVQLAPELWNDESLHLQSLKYATQNQRSVLSHLTTVILSHVVPYDENLWLARDQEGYPLFVGFDSTGRLSLYTPWREDFIGPGPALRLVETKKSRAWVKA